MTERLNNIIENRNIILYIMIFSILLKLSILGLIGPQPFLDGRWYMSCAQNIFESGFSYPSDELRDAPGTPYFYALFFPLTKLFGYSAFALANIIVATATIYVLYKISLLIFESRSIAIWTAFAASIYPFFNFYAMAILTESIYNFLLYISLFYAVRAAKNGDVRSVWLFAAWFAVATLTRFTGLAMLPFMLSLLSFFVYRKNGFKQAIAAFFGATIFFALVMSPWWIRNYSIFGEFVATSKGESGKVLYSGNNPKNKTGGGIGVEDVDFTQFEQIKDPIAKDEAMRLAAIDWITENPVEFALLSAKKLMRLYQPIMHASQYSDWKYSIVSLASYGIVLPLFLCGLYYFRGKLALLSPMLLYAVLLTGVHMIMIASVRYRLPIEPFMIILAIALGHEMLKKRFT